MSTNRMRITSYVAPSLGDVLRRLAVVQDRTVSAVVSEILGELEPSLRDVVELGEAFEAASESQRAALRAGADETAAAVGPHVRALVSEFQALMGGLEGQTPDTSNTGVR